MSKQSELEKTDSKQKNNFNHSLLSLQKELDADPRSIQQTEINFMLNTNAQILTVLEKSKDIVLEFYK